MTILSEAPRKARVSDPELEAEMLASEPTEMDFGSTNAAADRQLDTLAMRSSFFTKE